jgi:HPt (histidine-containing phosphotransfer) domain-containing protein
MGDEVLAHRVATQLLHDVPGQLQHLQAALAQNDSALLARKSHTLKGVAANTCCEHLRQLALELEQTSKAGDLTAAPPLLARVHEEFLRVSTMLAAHRWH